jgi:hypothetical protein
MWLEFRSDRVHPDGNICRRGRRLIGTLGVVLDVMSLEGMSTFSRLSGIVLQLSLPVSRLLRVLIRALDRCALFYIIVSIETILSTPCRRVKEAFM